MQLLTLSIFLFRNLVNRLCTVVLVALIFIPTLHAEKKTIKAIYIPLADHYASIIAYEKYRDKMVHADFQIEQMKSWDLLRAYFQSGEVDMAYVMSPLAMDMFRERPKSRWVAMMHRDGNALAINELLNKEIIIMKRTLA